MPVVTTVNLMVVKIGLLDLGLELVARLRLHLSEMTVRFVLKLRLTLKLCDALMQLLENDLVLAIRFEKSVVADLLELEFKLWLMV